MCLFVCGVVVADALHGVYLFSVQGLLLYTDCPCRASHPEGHS